MDPRTVVNSPAEFSSSTILADGFKTEENIEAAGGEPPSLSNAAIELERNSGVCAIELRSSDSEEERSPDQAFRYTDTDNSELKKEIRTIVTNKYFSEGEEFRDAIYDANNVESSKKNIERENFADRSLTAIKKPKNLVQPTNMDNELKNRVIVGLKILRLVAARLIDNCKKSNSARQVMADILGEDLLSHVTRLSVLGSRDKKFQELSHWFAEPPTEYTPELLSLLEEFIRYTIPSTDNNASTNGSTIVNEKCRRYNESTEYKSMRDFQVSSLSVNEYKKTIEGEEESANFLAAPNSTDSGRVKRVCRKTRKKIMKIRDSDSPNGAKIYYKVENAGSESVLLYREAEEALDDTEASDYWKNLSEKISPSKKARFHFPCTNGSPELPSYRKDFIPYSFENFKGFKSLEISQEIGLILAAGLVQKHKKYFEELAGALKSEWEVKRTFETLEIDSLMDSSCEGIFISTPLTFLDSFALIESPKDRSRRLRKQILVYPEDSIISEK